MTKPVKISTLLTRAAKYIEENGWVRGAFFKYRNGRRIEWNDIDDLLEVARAKACPACARGALYVVEDPELSFRDREVRHQVASSYIEAALGGEYYSVPDWNDREDQTKEEVVAGLKAAAKAARKDGK